MFGPPSRLSSGFPALIKAGRALGFHRVLNQIPGDRCTRLHWEIYSAKIWMFGVTRETRYFAQQKNPPPSSRKIYEFRFRAINFAKLNPGWRYFIDRTNRYWWEGEENGFRKQNNP